MSSGGTPQVVAPSVTAEAGGLAVAQRAAPVAVARPRAGPTPAAVRAQLATVLEGAFPDARFEVYCVGADANLEPVSERGGSTPLLNFLRSRVLLAHRDLTEPCVFPAVTELLGRTVMSAPLGDDAGAFLGLVVVERGPWAPDFTDRDLDVLQGLAALIAPAVQRVRPQDAARRLRREIDLRRACRFQRRLMGGTLPQGIGVTAIAEYRPALGVGGDFYSLRHLGDGRVWAAIGDVSGNGVSAALVMARVASDLDRALGALDAPSAVLAAINGHLAGADADMFVTASCLALDVASRTLTVANAGHQPLTVRRTSGEVFTCGGASGAPLGIERCDYRDEVIPLGPGDIVLLSTDGLHEALDLPSGLHGVERLEELVRGSPHDARAIHGRLCAAVDRARRAADLDDVTWVALQLAP